MDSASAAFSLRRGDDGSVAIPIQNADGSYASIDGATIRFTYGFTADGPPKGSKTLDDDIERGAVEIDGREVPAFIVPMPATETIRLQAFRTYLFQARVTFASDGGGGAIQTVLVGSFTVEPSQD